MTRLSGNGQNGDLVVSGEGSGTRVWLSLECLGWETCVWLSLGESGVGDLRLDVARGIRGGRPASGCHSGNPGGRPVTCESGVGDLRLHARIQ